MSARANIRFEDWEAKQMLDPEFRAAAEELEPAYQVARRLLQLQLGIHRIDEKLEGGKMKEDSCKPECCAEEETTLLVLPIYNAYLKKTCYDSEQALRLTFLEIQHSMGRALTWPNR